MPKKTIPQFRNDEEAAEFWDTHSLADYWDETEPADDVTFAPNALKMKQVCLRLSPTQIARLKRRAAEKGIGYQTLIRVWITERERQEQEAETTPGAASPSVVRRPVSKRTIPEPKRGRKAAASPTR
jgi:predicted DNA binding CopG/RHH family protein